MENFCIKSVFNTKSLMSCIRKHKLRSIKRLNKICSFEINEILGEISCEECDVKKEMVYSICYAYKQEYIREFVLDSYDAVKFVHDLFFDKISDKEAGFNHYVIPRIVDFKGNDLCKYNFEDLSVECFDDIEDVCPSDYDADSDSSDNDSDEDSDEDNAVESSVNSRSNSNDVSNNVSNNVSNSVRESNSSDYVPSAKYNKVTCQVDATTEIIGAVASGISGRSEIDTRNNALSNTCSNTCKINTTQGGEIRKRKIPARAELLRVDNLDDNTIVLD